MPVQGSYTQAKEPMGSWLLKIGIVVAIVIIGLIILFGVAFKGFDPIGLILNIIGIIIMLALIGLAIKGLMGYFAPKPFSPTEDFRTSMLRIMKKAKPFNVKNLYLRGEDMRTYARWGKIIGLGFLPYQTSRVERDRFGKPIPDRNAKGEVLYEKEWSKTHHAFVDIPKVRTQVITEKDGDILIATERFSFPLNIFFRSVDIVRAHKQFVSDLVGDIFIKDVNLVPYGEWLYPAKQWQSDISKVMKENEALAIITTHRNNLDLVSNVTQMSLGADPTFQKIMLAQSERLSSGFVNQGSGQQ